MNKNYIYLKIKLTIFVFVLLFLSIYFLPKGYATEDPKSFPNNKFGVHILFPSELGDAAKFVNSSGGDWGYVTIPIQAGDKDLLKWQQFMDDAKRLHVTPIIRLSTEGDYFTTHVWRKPEYPDVLDFANFLNSLDWPVKNRYIVIFNEVNRDDEWGGAASASEYAQVLSYAVEAFKAENSDFFIISAGLDNASENSEYIFMQEMHVAVPNVFNKIDGIGSHSYPNPGFEQPPSVLTKKSISSFIYERQLAELLGDKKLPVFITETGWSSNKISKPKIASYFTEAFNSVWSSNDVVAVTPFLFNAGTEPFAQFSLINNNGEKNEIYNAIKDIPKIKGNPTQSKMTIVDKHDLIATILPTKDFTNHKQFDSSEAKSKVSVAVELVRWLLRL